MALSRSVCSSRFFSNTDVDVPFFFLFLPENATKQSKRHEQKGTGSQLVLALIFRSWCFRFLFFRRICTFSLQSMLLDINCPLFIAVISPSIECRLLCMLWSNDHASIVLICSRSFGILVGWRCVCEVDTRSWLLSNCYPQTIRWEVFRLWKVNGHSTLFIS